MKTLINSDSIHSVEVYEKKVNIYLTYRPKSKFMWIIPRPEGLYDRTQFVQHQDDSHRFYVEDDTVYFKPHIIINYTSGWERVTFETLDEMNAYIKDLKLYTNYITVDK